MKIKVSDYIADFFSKNGINTVFTVVGGGAMHLNASFGHSDSINCVYNHHEQASSMAAEAYFRVHNKMAGVCVTSGPGAINALNGVAGAYQDSIPMIVISGQAKSTLTVRKNKLDLRTLGPQEFDIVSALKNFTKYSEMIEDSKKIKYCLEKAFYLALNGRPGPCWLDIPVDIQGTFVETDDLESFVKPDESCLYIEKNIEQKVSLLFERLSESQRPILYAGNGIRIAGAAELLKKISQKFHIPVVTCWDSIDLMETDDDMYVGRAGTMGDRAGNFAVQNSDFLLAIGNRLSIYQVGYNVNTWAREAFVVDVDIDYRELKKPTIRVDLPICYDAKLFLEKMLEKDDCLGENGEWIRTCNQWKNKYPVVLKEYYQYDSPMNVYAAIDCLSRKLPKNMVTVVANGSASVVGSAAYYIKQGQRFIMNCAISSMGYDLPAAIGACVANNRNKLICIAGDGSIMMNIQELQTIVTNKLPIKIVIINNEGYHQIRLTQRNLFDGKFVGVGPESRDLGFPDFEKISEAFDIPYFSCCEIKKFDTVIEKFLDDDGYAILEIFCDTKQAFVPKSATKKLADGTLVSPPLEDLAPFLERSELKENMIIDLVEDRNEYI